MTQAEKVRSLLTRFSSMTEKQLQQRNIRSPRKVISRLREMGEDISTVQVEGRPTRYVMN